MKFKDKVTMSVDDWRSFESDEDFEFAYGTVDFLSTRPNSHKIIYSEDVIKEYANSIINKWVIAEYDEYEQDVTTHTMNQHIVGRIPEQQIKYRYDEDGYLVASADIILSKLYATEIYSLFLENNYRAVSVEHLVNYTPETEHFLTGSQNKDVVGFNITGVTILGLKYAPSVPKSNVYLTQMSEDTLEKAEIEYHKYSENMEKLNSHPINTTKESIDMGEWDGDKAKRDLLNEKDFINIAPKVCLKLEEGWRNREITKLDYPVMNLKNGEWVYNRKGLASALSYAKQHNESAVVSKIEKIYRKLGLDQEEKMDVILETLEQIKDKLNKEETMAEDIKDTVETVENSEIEDANVETVENSTDNDTVENDCGETTEKVENSCEDVEEQSECEKNEDTEENESTEKMAELQAKLTEYETKISQYESQIEVLQAYKDNIEKQKTNNIIQETLSKVKESVSEDVYKEIVSQSKECTYETVGIWKNETLAKAYDGLTEKMSKGEEFVDMGKPMNTQDTDFASVFDRM